MTNTNKLILDLISKNASVNEICSVTGLSHKQLFYRMNMLKIKGYNFKHKYYYNGDIVYELLKGVNKEKTNETTLLTSPNEQEFKAIIISDLHLGNIYERPDLLEEVYNLCIKKGINIILNIGDLVDGLIGSKYDKKYDNIERQIEHLLKVYPFDKNILNFICLGNHDYDCLDKEGLDINNVLSSKRHDLISLGFGKSLINVKNDKILLKHETCVENDLDLVGTNLRFEGHSHRTKTTVRDTIVNFGVSSLSDMMLYEKMAMPSLAIITTNFKWGLFEKGNYEQYIFIDNKLCKVSEIECDLIRGKKLQQPIINNEEERKSINLKEYKGIDEKQDTPKNKDKIKEEIVNTEKPKELKLSQVDKFYKRYNIEKK